MKVWIFVEGESDRIALNTLWAKWRDALGQSGWGIHVIPLDDKSRFFRKIGHRAAEKLIHDARDLAVGLSDLYPNREYDVTDFKHANLAELKTVEAGLVGKALADVFRLSERESRSALSRFFPSALKHDAEMLLLAARDQLRTVLGRSDALGKWRNPVEDQNQMKPPKYVVKELFQAKKGRKYRDTGAYKGRSGESVRYRHRALPKRQPAPMSRLQGVGGLDRHQDRRARVLRFLRVEGTRVAV